MQYMGDGPFATTLRRNSTLVSFIQVLSATRVFLAPASMRSTSARVEGGGRAQAYLP